MFPVLKRTNTHKTTTTLLCFTLQTVGRKVLSQDPIPVKLSISVEQLDSSSAITSHNYYTLKCQQIIEHTQTVHMQEESH